MFFVGDVNFYCIIMIVYFDYDGCCGMNIVIF